MAYYKDEIEKRKEIINNIKMDKDGFISDNKQEYDLNAKQLNKFATKEYEVSIAKDTLKNYVTLPAITWKFIYNALTFATKSKSKYANFLSGIVASLTSIVATPITVLTCIPYGIDILREKGLSNKCAIYKPFINKYKATLEDFDNKVSEMEAIVDEIKKFDKEITNSTTITEKKRIAKQAKEKFGIIVDEKYRESLGQAEKKKQSSKKVATKQTIKAKRKEDNPTVTKEEIEKIFEAQNNVAEYNDEMESNPEELVSNEEEVIDKE